MRSALSALLVGVLGSLFAASPALAQQPNGKGTDLFVTIAARECPSYADIMANRARNDIQESLRDLGKNTVYKAGQPIDPGVEATNDPNCTPLPGWRFTLGTGYRTRAVSGPWGSLSIVTDPYDTEIVTEPRIPLLDYAGRPTDDFLEGATTIELTKAQAKRAATANSLWIQGGTPSDPILNGPYPGQFGFGPLRVRDPLDVVAVQVVDRARLLLRVLRPAAADQRDDRDPQGGPRYPGRDPDLQLRRQSQLQRGQRLQLARQQRPAGEPELLPRGDRT